MKCPYPCFHSARSPAVTLLLAAALAASVQTRAADATPAAATEQAVSSASLTVSGPPLALVVNKSTILRLAVPATRISIANPAVADITPINSREIYVLGKAVGSTNLIIWDKSGNATMMDVKVMPEPVPPAPASEDKDSVEVIKGLNKSKMDF
jgi:pilus assembly protein CpaC